MQVSFGKIIPTVVYLDGRTANQEEREKITTNLCRILRNDPGGKPTLLDEQQRRYFGAIVNDYKFPRRKFKAGETESSRVTTANIGRERYLVTGKEIDIKDELGRIYKHESSGPLSRQAEEYVQLGLTDEITERNILETNAAKKRRSQLDQLRKDTTLSKILFINAIKVPNQKTDRETYKIALIDFKA